MNKRIRCAPFITCLRTYSLLLLAHVFTTVLVGCSRIPWTIDNYIAALKRPERGLDQNPEEVITALNITQGMIVTDIGVGSAYFTRRLAEVVGPTGRVLAVDVDPVMLAYNRKALLDQGLAERVEFILRNTTRSIVTPRSKRSDVSVQCLSSFKNRLDYSTI